MSTKRPADGYLAFHAPRYRYLLNVCERYLPPGGEGVLDIGLSAFTAMLRDRLDVNVDTLGLELETDSQASGGHHFAFDLNHLGESGAPRPNLPRYRLIVFAEVLEHLHTSPLVVLPFLHDALVEDGILIVQTPNAASLGKRLKLLAGWNPYEMIRQDRTNPGHFREYTVAELRDLAARTGFAIAELNQGFYFDARFADHDEHGGAGVFRPFLGRLKNVVYRTLPRTLREGVTLVLRRDPARLASSKAPRTGPEGG